VANETATITAFSSTASISSDRIAAVSTIAAISSGKCT
jgi:hypothetical protein